MATLKLGVLGSGKGSNFRAIADAIDRGDHDALRGEIGDLLFEGVEHLEADDERAARAQADGRVGGSGEDEDISN